MVTRIAPNLEIQTMENTTASNLPTASFFCQENSSDKEYHMQVAVAEGGFVVKYQYGRRGSTLIPAVKPAKPVSLETAIKLFDGMCKERLAKGYTLGASTGATTIETVVRQKSQLMPQLLNAIDDSMLAALFQDAAMCMQEKEDGERVMVSRKDAVVTASNKLGFTRPLPQPVADAILALPCDDVILDGELIGNQYRIFDLLSLDGACLRQLGYKERYDAYLALLSGVSTPAITAVKAWSTPAEKRAHFERIRNAKGEGVVFKANHASYAAGRPNSGGSQLKYKFTESVTCIVDRISNVRRSIALALLDGKGALVSVGNVTVPVNMAIPRVAELVEVRYLYRYENGSLFQPVLLGMRNDIAWDECTLTQVRRIKVKLPLDEEELALDHEREAEFS
jgi:bifunctional non-homologous end joining protein LigD